RLRRWTAASGRRACSASRAGSALSVTGGPAAGRLACPLQARGCSCRASGDPCTASHREHASFGHDQRAGWIASIRSLGLRVTRTRVGPACHEQTAPGALSAGRDVLLRPLPRASQDEEGRPAGRAALPVPLPCEVAGLGYG